MASPNTAAIVDMEVELIPGTELMDDGRTHLLYLILY
jgi:hypothetical protein